jgi:site-specific DNA-methyltransferase (adenine-specific)
MADGPAASMGRIENRDINKVIPYWRNPRRITEQAVDALASSIKEYGYNQPIVVDEKGVIIIGHTRYAAMRKMKVSQVSVLVADSLNAQQVKQLRVVDNRAAEFSEWDLDLLLAELDKVDSNLMKTLFYDFTHADDEAADAALNDAASGGQIEWSTEDTSSQGADDREVEFVCPSCFHDFTVEVTPLMIEVGRIETSPVGSAALDEEVSHA